MRAITSLSILSTLIVACAPATQPHLGHPVQGTANLASFRAIIECVKPTLSAAGFELRDFETTAATQMRRFTARQPLRAPVTGERFEVISGNVLYSSKGDTAWVVSEAVAGTYTNEKGSYTRTLTPSPDAVRASNAVNVTCGPEQKVVASETH